MKKLLILLLLLVGPPAHAQSLNFPGFPGQGGSAIFDNFTAGPGNISITGNTPQSNINNVNLNGTINVKAYGAKGDSSTDDTNAIQSAFNAAKTSFQCVHFPRGQYVVTQDLDFTSGSSEVRCIEGEDANQTGLLCENTGGNCLDLSGADGFSIKNMQFIGGTSTANAPKTLLLLARTGNQGFGHLLQNVWTQSYGPYTIYDYGAEVGNWYYVRSNGPGITLSACN